MPARSCQCPERRAPITSRRWEVCSKPGDGTTVVRCKACGAIWTTRAKFADTMPYPWRRKNIMDSTKLKPCLHCGGTDLRVYWNDIYEKHYVRCHTCHMQGPEIYGREAAAEAWNSLPRRHEIMPNDVDCAGCPERRYRSHDHD